MKFWDFHTHKTGKKNIFNLNYSSSKSIPTFNYIQAVTLSAHPWDSDRFNFSEFVSSYEYVKSREDLKIVGIGEIGIDRLRGAPLRDQVSQLGELVSFSSEVGLPMVFHCVKSLEDILKVLSDQSVIHTCLFHDFNGNSKMIDRVIQMGHLIGVGRSIFRDNSRIMKSFSTISLDHILLETDDLNIEIAHIYAKVAEIKNVTIDQVRHKMIRNSSKIFELP